ncbi:hypothetical protein L1887_34956 [Cichorium endivia]|nr:hypothetical protein L1887_34956 [Cichorium endivia]
MEAFCDLCRAVRAVVYCKSDAAKLCFQCDNRVHSANSLSRRHPRSLLCDNCNMQPAIVHHLFDKMFLCQVCDLNENGCSSGQGHSIEELNAYTGCPSNEEFLKILSTIRGGGPSIDPQFHPMSNLNLNENLINDQKNEEQMGLVASRLNEIASAVKFEPWIINPSSVIPPHLTYLPSCDQKDPNPFFPDGSNISQDGSDLNNLGLNEGEGLCDNVDLGDVALSFDGGYEMFNGGDCLVVEKNLSATESNSHIENAIEVKRFGKQIRYHSRKVRADTRKRVKGRFVKAGEEYDYDPVVTTGF